MWAPSRVLAFVALLTIVPMIDAVSAADFAPGQVWAYKTRPSESDSTLMILKIDAVRQERIIHIAVRGLRMKSTRAPGVYGEAIDHLPIEEIALRNSVTNLVQKLDHLPAFEEGYAQWKAAFNRQQAGYFTLSVAGCVDVVEQAAN